MCSILRHICSLDFAEYLNNGNIDSADFSNLFGGSDGRGNELECIRLVLQYNTSLTSERPGWAHVSPPRKEMPGSCRPGWEMLKTNLFLTECAINMQPKPVLCALVVHVREKCNRTSHVSFFIFPPLAPAWLPNSHIGHCLCRSFFRFSFLHVPCNLFASTVLVSSFGRKFPAQLFLLYIRKQLNELFNSYSVMSLLVNREERSGACCL